MLELTPRENDVYLLLLSGRPLADCAAELGITYATFQVYSRFVYTKKHVKNRLQLMAQEIAKAATKGGNG